MSEKVKILFNPSCSKCNESLDLLKGFSCEIEVIEYLKDTPSENELREIIQFLDIKPQNLIRKSEELFKVNFEGKDFSDEEWISIMLKFPELIERPIVIQGNKAIIGRPPGLILDFIEN
ncbi:MAG: ArsC/Spx/MgsR family protein [Bacteroidota bacterium]